MKKHTTQSLSLTLTHSKSITKSDFSKAFFVLANKSLPIMVAWYEKLENVSRTVESCYFSNKNVIVVGWLSSFTSVRFVLQFRHQKQDEVVDWFCFGYFNIFHTLFSGIELDKLFDLNHLVIRGGGRWLLESGFYVLANRLREDYLSVMKTWNIIIEHNGLNSKKQMCFSVGFMFS